MFSPWVVKTSHLFAFTGLSDLFLNQAFDSVGTEVWDPEQLLSDQQFSASTRVEKTSHPFFSLLMQAFDSMGTEVLGLVQELSPFVQKLTDPTVFLV